MNIFANSLIKTGSAKHGTKVIIGAVGISFFYSSIHQGPAKCAGLDDEGLETLALPVFKQVTFGGLMGFASGYALKKVGKMAAVGVGLTFMALQGLQYNGFIEVDWNRIWKEVVFYLDQDNDGDFDEDDIRILYRRLINVLEYNIPSAGGFVPFFFMGVRYG